MGSGNSKLNAGQAVRRLEELKKRRSAAKLPVEGTLSKKQLLKDAEEEDSNSQSSHEASHETKTEDKVPTKEIQLAKEETVVRVITTEKLSRVVPLPYSECEVDEEKDSKRGNVEQENKHSDHDNREKLKDSNGSNVEQDNKHIDHDDQEKVTRVDEKKAEAEVKIEKGETNDPKLDNEQFVDAKSDDDDDDENEESEKFGIFLPGSPSFRIYCIEAEKRREEESRKQATAMHQKSHSADSGVSQPSRSERSGNLNELPPVAEIEPTTKRKGNKGKKFGGVKRLLKVKSCYYPMCSCTGDERRRVTAAKAANRL